MFFIDVSMRTELVGTLSFVAPDGLLCVLDMLACVDIVKGGEREGLLSVCEEPVE